MNAPSRPGGPARWPAPIVSVVLLSALALAWVATPALAQDPSGGRAEQEDREAEMFGAPEDPEPSEPPGPGSASEPADSSADREAEMFGAPTSTTPPARPSAAERSGRRGRRAEPLAEPGQPLTSGARPEAERPEAGAGARPEAKVRGAGRRPEEEGGGGEGLLDEREVEALLSEANDKLDLGAFFFLRAQYAALERGEPGTFPLSSPNFLDVYIDGRPNDRLRAYAQGRMYYDPTLTGAQPNLAATLGRGAARDLRVLLDQLWFKLDVLRTAFVSVGRQRIKWGSGRAWNPTDFLNQVRDPLAIFDERLGVDLVKVHVPVESLGWNFYALATYSGANTPSRVGGALRAEIVLGPAELALSTVLQKDRPLRFGADLSAGIGLFDVHVEMALSHNVRTPFFTGAFETSELRAVQYSRADEVIPQIVSGAEISLRYSDRDSVFLGAEYFYNGSGYRASSLPNTLYPLLILNGAFTPFYLGRHYASAYAFLPNPGEWNNTSFTLSGLSNLSDESVVLRLDYQVLLLTYLRFNAFGMFHAGRAGGEFRFAFDDDELPEDLRALLRLTPGLEKGLEIVAPLFEIGVGLALEI